MRTSSNAPRAQAVGERRVDSEHEAGAKAAPKARRTVLGNDLARNLDERARRAVRRPGELLAGRDLQAMKGKRDG